MTKQLWYARIASAAIRAGRYGSAYVLFSYAVLPGEIYIDRVASRFMERAADQIDKIA